MLERTARAGISTPLTLTGVLGKRSIQLTTGTDLALLMRTEQPVGERHRRVKSSYNYDVDSFYVSTLGQAVSVAFNCTLESD